MTAFLSLETASKDEAGRQGGSCRGGWCTHPYGLSVPGLDKLSEGNFPSPLILAQASLVFQPPLILCPKEFPRPSLILGQASWIFQPALILCPNDVFHPPPYSGSGELGSTTPLLFCVRRIFPIPLLFPSWGVRLLLLRVLSARRLVWLGRPLLGKAPTLPAPR